MIKENLQKIVNFPADFKVVVNFLYYSDWTTLNLIFVVKRL